jgi:hypothetical protein
MAALFHTERKHHPVRDQITKNGAQGAIQIKTNSASIVELTNRAYKNTHSPVMI